MNEIRSLLKTAGRRLELNSLISKLHLVTIVAGGLVLLAVLAERVFNDTHVIPWPWVLPAVGAAAALAVLRLWHVARRREIDVAVEVDDRLELRERLSTALHCRDRGDAFARAAVGDAVEAARDPRVREQVRRAFPIRSPRRWWLSPAVVAAAIGLSFVAPFDLFAREAAAEPDLAEEIERAQEEIRKVIDPIEESPQLREELADILDDMASKPLEPDAIKDRKDAKRSALKKLTDLDRALRDIIDGPKGKTADAIKNSLAKLKTPKEGPAKDLAEALAAGDFEAAKEALEKLLADAKAGKLDAELAKQLAAQLDDLAQQLAQLAQQQKQLEELLKQAGLDPKLAANPQALQQAIQNAQNLNQQQMQQLMQMAQAQQMAQQMMQQMAGGMQQMAQQMQMGQMGQMGDGLQNQLNQLEQMQQLLQQAQAAANQCQGQCQGLGQGLGMQAALQQWALQLQQGQGAFGQRGQGRGGKAPILPTPTRTKIEKVNSKSLPGDIIARQYIDGPQIVGESKAKLKQVEAAIARGYAEAQSDLQIPRKYEDAHKHYFGELKERLVPTEETGETGEAAEQSGDE